MNFVRFLSNCFFDQRFLYAPWLGKEFGHDLKSLKEFIHTNAGKKYMTDWHIFVLRFLKKEKAYL